jgi:predicted transcriptional regulator
MRQARPPKDIPPPLELECLKSLWALGEGNVRAVQGEMQARRPLAYTTVMTLLDRLARKGVVGRRKAGRFFVYTPQVDRETMRRRAISDLADTLFDGSKELLESYCRNGVPPREPEREEPQRLDASLL